MLAMMVVMMAAAPIQVEPGKSFAGVHLGMTLAEVKKLHKLKPEEDARAERTGYTSGPLFFIFNPQDKLVLVGVELQKSGGLRIGKVRVPARITAEDFVKLVPGCTLSMGSGGHAIACGPVGAPTLNAYDSYGSKHLSWVQMGPG